MPKNTIDLVEEAYATSPDESAWLSRVLDLYTSQFEGVVGHGAYVLSRAADGGPRFSTAILSGVEDAGQAFAAMHAGMSGALAEIVYPTGSRCQGFQEDWQSLRTAAEWDEATLRVGDGLSALFGSYGGTDLLFACSCDHTGSGVFLGAIVNGTKLSDSARRANRLAAIHVAAGLRLRTALADASIDAHAEAVLEVDGRVAHATGAALPAEMRSVLQRAVQNVDRARTRQMRSEELEALNLWLGLVDGRWSVIDRYDTDGRRYYVAIANPPDGVAARQLTEAEGRVVAQAVSGEPTSLIAYSLGIAESTVSTHLRTAMRKLGVASRIELLRLARSLGATGVPIPPDSND